MEIFDPGNVPTDVQAERKVLGACILSAAAIPKAADLRPEDFYSKPYGRMHAVIQTLAAEGKPVTADTVARGLEGVRVNNTTALQELGGASAVAAVIEGVLPDEVDYWVDRVRVKRQERDLLAFAEDARRAATKGGGELAKTIARLEERLADIHTPGSSDQVVDLEGAMEAFLPRLDKYINDPDGITGLEIGWPEFDVALDGLQPGVVTMVYAPSSRFKSLFVQNIGWHLARQGIPGLWFTTEMPREQVMERVLQLEVGKNLRWMRRTGEIRQIADYIHERGAAMTKYPIFTCDRSDLDIGYVAAETMRQRRWNKIEYIIVDLIDHVGSSEFKDDSIQQQSTIMKKLKALAKRAGIHVIFVSHVSKGDKAIRGKQADLDPEDTKGSSAKYQDSDNCISVMPVGIDSDSGRYYPLERAGITARLKNNGALLVLVSITKNRMGELARIPFMLDYDVGGRMFPTDRQEAVAA